MLFFVGVFAGCRYLPGISRSGSTLVGGLTTGLKRDFAVKFAFLISIPSILGSVVLEVPDALKKRTGYRFDRTDFGRYGSCGSFRIHRN